MKISTKYKWLQYPSGCSHSLPESVMRCLVHMEGCRIGSREGRVEPGNKRSGGKQRRNIKEKFPMCPRLLEAASAWSVTRETSGVEAREEKKSICKPFKGRTVLQTDCGFSQMCSPQPNQHKS